ncbi:DUF222 domain-containing protein, partial [Burkholderia cenocepacia]|uniref:DUF222 domain-containing protein n=1 Tax=Burkholderia cenocepacia TaxID=95486 RepID=UPI0038CC0DDD
MITDAGAPLTSSDVTPEQRAAYAVDMVAVAETTTPGRLAKVARRAADAHLTEPLTVRHRAAREERRVRVTEVDDGMSWFGALVPTVLAKGAEHRLRTGARAKAKDDPRTIDQWMADAACELLLAGTGAPIVERTPDGTEVEHAGLLSTIRPVVQVTIPVTTLTG